MAKHFYDFSKQLPQEKRPIHDILEGDRLEPSAPSVVDGHVDSSRSNCVPENSGHLLPSYEPLSHQDSHHGVMDSAATPCPSCAAKPPTYSESLQHQVV